MRITFSIFKFIKFQISKCKKRTHRESNPGLPADNRKSYHQTIGPCDDYVESSSIFSILRNRPKLKIKKMRQEGFEPPLATWKADMLPLTLLSRSKVSMDNALSLLNWLHLEMIKKHSCRDLNPGLLGESQVSIPTGPQESSIILINLRLSLPMRYFIMNL